GRSTWTILPKLLTSETRLHGWAGEEDWTQACSDFDSPEHKAAVFDALAGWQDLVAQWCDETCYAQAMLDEWNHVRNRLLEGSKYVTHPQLSVPIGLMRTSRGKTVLVHLHAANPHVLIHARGDDRTRRALLDDFIRPYRHKDKGRRDL